MADKQRNYPSASYDSVRVDNISNSNVDNGIVNRALTGVTTAGASMASNLRYTDYDSSCSSEELEEPDWMESVNDRGNVLYVQPEVSEDSLQAHNQLANGGYLISTSNENLLDIDERKSSIRTKFFKPTTKLKALINRSKENKESRPLVNLDRPETLGDQACSSAGQGISLCDYEVHDIMFNVRRTQRNLGRRASRFESMLGMVPRTRFEHFRHDSDNDCSVIVHGFVPDGGIENNHDVQIGDWIRCINNIEVDSNNINGVLESCYGTNQVKLTIYRPRPTTPSYSSSCRSSKRNANVSKGRIKVLSGNNESQQMEHVIDDFREQYHHIVMFLGSPSSSSSLQTEEDIKYEYPAGVEKKLKTVRGLFYTVCNVIPDVTSSIPTSSTLIYDESLIHVCYVVEDRKVLVVALPAQCLTLIELLQLTNEFVRFLRLECKTLARAFEDTENKSNLDEMFSEIFRSILIPRYQQSDLYFLTRSLEDSLGMSKTLPLPDELQLNVSDFLSELESADFSDFVDLEPRRSFGILGCCFHYKGYAIVNHLPTGDFEDIHSVLRFNYLLKMTSGQTALVSRLIMWKEIFPSFMLTNTEELINPSTARHYSRYFLLTVGIKHGLLSTLLKSEHFSNSSNVYPGPNPAYIDKAKDTLEAIFDDGIADQINHIIRCNLNNQTLANPQSFLQKAKSSRRFESRDSSNLFNVFSKSGTSSVSSSQHKSMTDLRTISKQGDTEFDGSSSRSRGTSDDITPILGRRHDRKHSKPPTTIDIQSRTNSADNLLWREGHHGKSSAFDLSSLRQETQAIMAESTLATQNNCLVTGHENTLFQYLSVENSEGVIIFPAETLSKNGNSLQKEVMENFRRSCLFIRKTFQNSYKNKDKRKQSDGGIFNFDNPLNHVNEQGMLFHCQVGSDKKHSNNLVYWVVGRQFINPRPREVYVCFHESAPQNTIELAFKLGFGWTP